MNEPIRCINVQPDPPRMAQHLTQLQQLGIRHARVSWQAWSGNHTGNAGWNWLPEWLAAGIEVLPVVLPDESVGQSYASRTLQLLDAFGDHFPYIQLGNEPDGRQPWEPQPTFGEGRALALRLRRQAEEIERIAPSVRLAGPSLAWNREGVRDFAAGLFSVPRAFDIATINIYGLHLWIEPLTRHQALREAGWEGPVWCTETGVGDAQARAMGYSDTAEYQTLNLRHVYQESPERYAYERIYWFQLNHIAPDHQDAGMGLVDQSGAPRASYHALESLARTDAAPVDS